MNTNHDLTIVGGGLAGCEAALQASKCGLKVKLYEMRPSVMTGAHLTGKLAELVCSNSLGSNLPDRASGVLKNELRRMGSFLLKIADETSLPAGRALAVDRITFAERVTNLIETSESIDVVRNEVRSIPADPLIIASGPLTSRTFSREISKLVKNNNLNFYDAIAPIIVFDSIDHTIAFKSSRYQDNPNNEGDYINLPFTKEQYYQFVGLLRAARRIKLKPFENKINSGVKAGSSKYFEGCLPVEVLAKRGDDALAYGPMRPVGLIDPRTNRRPYAVIQLRQENLSGDLFNMVGFQTNLAFDEQIRVFRTIPGLQDAKECPCHNILCSSYISSPALLDETLKFRNAQGIFFAGQITGVEGYVGNIGTGLLAGWNASRLINGLELLALPNTTILGALCNYISSANSALFQPMKANFGIVPNLDGKVKLAKRERFRKYSERSACDLEEFLKTTVVEIC